jgi:hypothetical protein
MNGTTEFLRYRSRLEVWQTISDVVIASAVLVGGIWAFYNFHKSKRTEAARWLQSLYKDFYFENQFKEIRSCLEYCYQEIVEPVLKRRIDTPDLPVDQADAKILTDLDSFLNYLEYISYLELHNHLRTRDRKAIFNYWFEYIKNPKHYYLQQYIIKYQFRQLELVTHLSYRPWLKRFWPRE